MLSAFRRLELRTAQGEIAGTDHPADLQLRDAIRRLAYAEANAAHLRPDEYDRAELTRAQELHRLHQLRAVSARLDAIRRPRPAELAADQRELFPGGDQ